jgi:cytochrome d ubiquinol oxidase subunit I
MGVLSDVVFLSRFQFAFTIAYHFLFVPLSVGLGLVVALAAQRAYKSNSAKDEAALVFWLKIFAATFVVGVATGITMEFAFGTNWADYSRYVGDIFGAPLAAEALFAFFLESVFLGVLLLGKKKVSRKFYTASAWLVWGGSCLSALWIIIADSWMQTPAGYEIVETTAGAKAVLTNFWAAAFNPSTVARYLHTVDSLLIFGAFIAIAIAAWYLLKKKHVDFAKKTISTCSIIALVTVILMMPFAHYQAVEVAQNQPEKLAAMEGQWEAGSVGMSLVGWVDEATHTTYAISIPGLTSFLASGSTTTSYMGLNDVIAEWGETAPVNFVFQAYHLMVAMAAIIVLVMIMTFVLVRKKTLGKKRWPLWIMVFAPIAPLLAIQAGWFTAEVGRQPWIVYGQLKTADAISLAVSAPELLITIVLFIVFYAIIFVAWLRIVLRFIRKGPDDETPAIEAVASASESATSVSTGHVVPEKEV